MSGDTGEGRAGPGRAGQPPPPPSATFEESAAFTPRSGGAAWSGRPISTGSLASSQSRAPRVFTAQAHSVTTCQPRFCSSLSTRVSRARFPSILATHHSTFDFGILKSGQFSWPCQKQPWTKTTTPYFGSTRSGLPGSDLFFGPRTVKR